MCLAVFTIEEKNNTRKLVGEHSKHDCEAKITNKLADLINVKVYKKKLTHF
jgi:hypothetical protein